MGASQNVDVLVLFPMAIESKHFQRQLRQRAVAKESTVSTRRIESHIVGVGSHSPVRWLDQWHEQGGRCGAIIVAGFAGALHGSARAGEAFWFSSVRHATGATIDLSGEDAAGHCLLTCDEPIRTTDQRRRYASEHGAIACDMETWHVAHWAQSKQIALRSCRVISDTIDEELPSWIADLASEKRLLRLLGRTTSGVIRQPASFRTLFRLALRTGRLQRSLSQQLWSALHRE